jgi:hypothetical protein
MDQQEFYSIILHAKCPKRDQPAAQGDSTSMKEEIENVCYNCGRKNSEHPSTGRFGTVILVGHECAWNPDTEFRNFVINTLQTSGYDLQDFQLEN